MVLRDGKSIRYVAHKTGLSRHTVAKYVNDSSPPSYKRQAPLVTPKLRDYKERLQTLHEYDLTRPKRERRTATKLYEQLVLEGYTGSYYPVRRYIHAIKLTKLSSSTTHIPMQFLLGDAMQFDWSEEHVILNGVLCKIKVAHFRLCHSRKPFIVAYMNERQEMLMDAFPRAFEFFGGVPRRVIIDNPKTMVIQVSRSKDRVFHPRFLAMMNHYVVEPVACTPASGWEKGQVERQVQDLRKTLFAPKLAFNNMEDLNTHLFQACDDLGSRTHPERQDKTVDEVFAEEKGHLYPTGNPFDGYVESAVRVRSTCLVQYDNNLYSVPSKFANTRVSLRAYADCIKVVSGQEVVAEHQRSFTKNGSYFDPLHYLDLLKTKPGALRNGAPFADWKLPSSMLKIKDHYMAQRGGDREFVNLLMLMQEHGIDLVERACDQAVKQGTLRLSAIINRINFLLDPKIKPLVNTDAYSKLTRPPEANCKRYEALYAGRGVAS